MHISLQSELCFCFRQMWKPDATAELKKTPKQPLHKVQCSFQGFMDGSLESSKSPLSVRYKHTDFPLQVSVP